MSNQNPNTYYKIIVKKLPMYTLKQKKVKKV